MTAKKRTLMAIAGVLVTMLLVPSVTGVASAVYLGNVGDDGKTGVGTLEATLKSARDKVLIAKQNPDTGSGTPYFQADGVGGAVGISIAVFGGISAAFFVKARKGKYAAPGLG